MSRFVRPSNYRHVYGNPAKRELVYDNIKISASAWDTNLVSASAKYLAVNYQSSGGGAFLVTPLDHTGKLPDLFPLCRAHTAPVLDTDWSPFNDSLVASAGEDGRVALTHVDESILRDALSGDHSDSLRDLEPTAKFSGHGRKAGHVLWHPTAEGILASASNDVKVWDCEHQQAAYTSDAHADMVQSLDWDYSGTVVATTCKDKKLRLFDPRAGTSAVTVADSHSGIKGSRVCWMGSLDRIVTTGFSRTSERQVYVWDSRDLGKGPMKTINIDQSSGSIMPFWVPGNNVLFLAGKGDGNVRYYEWENDDLHFLTEYSSPQPQRGMCFLPPRALNTSENEIARAFKATGSMIEPISFIVPRKSDAFQTDLFPPAKGETPALTARQWLDGETKGPVLVDLQSGKTSKGEEIKVKKYEAAIPAPTPTPAPVPVQVAKKEESTPAPAPVAPKEAEPIRQATPSAPAPVAPTAAPAVVSEAPTLLAASHTNGISKFPDELDELKRENERLKDELSERDTLIRELELKLERIKAAFN